MNKIIIIALSVLLGGGFIGFIVFAKESKKESKISGDSEVVTLSKSGMIEGDPKAPLTLIEFADFQCPYCGDAHPILKAVLKEYEGRVQFNFKHFPLLSIHKNALPAATAAEAAGVQGKFWEMHDLLFERQDEWSNDPKASSRFEEYAKEIGLDVDKYRADLKDDALGKKIDEQRNEGISVGVNSTPTFFLNGKRIELKSLSADEFKSLFDAELAKVSPSEQSSISTPSADTTGTPSE